MTSPGTPVSGVLTDPGRTGPSTAWADRRAPGVTGPGGSSRPCNGRRRRQQSTPRLDVQCPLMAGRLRWEKDQPVTGKSMYRGGRRELLRLRWGDLRPGAPPKPSLQMGSPPFGNKNAAMIRCRTALRVVPPQCSQLRNQWGPNSDGTVAAACPAPPCLHALTILIAKLAVQSLTRAGSKPACSSAASTYPLHSRCRKQTPNHHRVV
jgi:hypothetical protein